MSLTKSLFGREIYDLTIDDVKSFFSTEQEETSLLEFKSGGAALELIHREVAAFLNTEGGVLVLGAPTEKSIGKNKKVCVGDLVPSIIIASQDVLIRSIASNISPSPAGIKVKTLPYENGNIFILEIPQSYNPPHQVNNEGRYYIRLDREAKAAPHGLVEAMFFKRQYPEIDVECRILYSPDLANDLATVEIHFFNNNHLTAEQVGYIIDIGGIKSLEDTNDKSTERSLTRGYLQTNGIFKDQILVKGVRKILEFDIKRAGPVLLVHVEYYCKNSTLEQKCWLFDFLKCEYVASYSSRGAQNNLQTGDIIKMFYERMGLTVPKTHANGIVHDSWKSKD